jgi:pseudoazurin
MTSRNRIALALLSALGLVALSPSGQAGQSHVVQLVSDYANGRMYFEPKSLHIEPGDTVTWVNLANEEHNIITFPDGFPQGTEPFESPKLEKQGETWSHTFTVEGTYEYHCLPHLPMGMHGVVIVGRASQNGEFHVPSPAELAHYRREMMQWFGDDAAAFKPRQQRDEPVTNVN